MVLIKEVTGSSAPKQLQLMLDKVPKPTTAGSDEVKLLSKQNTDAFKEVIQGLWFHHNLRERTARFLAEQIELQAVKSQLAGKDVFDDISQLQALDDVWVTGFIHKRQPQLSLDLLGKVLGKDRMDIYFMLSALLKASLQLRLVPGMEDKAATTMIFSDRCDEVFTNMSWHVGPDGVTEDGEVMWEHIGIYYFTWSPDGQATHVHHRPTNTTKMLPRHIVILEDEFKIVKNWSEILAKAVSHDGDAKHPLYTLFDKGTGPHAIETWTGRVGATALTAALKGAKEKMAAKQKQEAEGQVVADAQVVKRHTTAAKVERGKKAREALAIRAKEREAKRAKSLRGSGVKADE